MQFIFSAHCMGARHCSRHGEEQCISYLFSGLKQHPLMISLPLWTGIGAGDTLSSAQGVRGFSQGSGRGWERSLRKAQRVGAAPFTSSGLFSEGQFSPWLPVRRRSPSEVTIRFLADTPAQLGNSFHQNQPERVC